MLKGWAPFDVDRDPTLFESKLSPVHTGAAMSFQAGLSGNTEIPDLWLTDWRGYGKLTDRDKARVAKFASVRGMLEPPMPNVKHTLLSSILGYYTYNDRPAGDELSYDYQVAKQARDLGYDIFQTTPKQGRICLWMSDDQKQATWGINVARPEVARWLGNLRAGYGGNFAGFHVDYWSPWGWIIRDPGYARAFGINGLTGEDQFWEMFRAGMRTYCQALRHTRLMRYGADTLIVGQQFHNGAAPYTEMRQINGRFCEVGPWSFGMSPDKHMMQFVDFKTIGVEPFQHVIEVREPTIYPPTMLLKVGAQMSHVNAAISWGRDATAGEGWPWPIL